MTEKTKPDNLVAEWDKRFRKAKARTERSLRKQAAREKQISLHDEEWQEDTETRLRRLEQQKPESKPPPPVRWFIAILDRVPPWQRGLVVLAVVGILAWRGAAWIGLVP